jgi:hypothetical protein
VVVVARGGSVQVVVGCRVFDLRGVASRRTEGRNGKGRRKGEERVHDSNITPHQPPMEKVDRWCDDQLPLVQNTYMSAWHQWHSIA